MKDTMKFKGLSISKEDFEEKYDVKLSNIEWTSMKSHAIKSYEENIDEFRLMVFRHIRYSMNEIGFKVKFENDNILFKKIDTEN